MGSFEVSVSSYFLDGLLRTNCYRGYAKIKRWIRLSLATFPSNVMALSRYSTALRSRFNVHMLIPQDLRSMEGNNLQTDTSAIRRVSPFSPSLPFPFSCARTTSFFIGILQGVWDHRCPGAVTFELCMQCLLDVPPVQWPRCALLCQGSLLSCNCMAFDDYLSQFCSLASVLSLQAGITYGWSNS